MKRYSGVLNLVLSVTCIVLLISQYSFKEHSEAKKVVESPAHQWFVPKLPEKISFAGEAVPMQRWDVKEKFDKEMLQNYYSPGNIIYLLKLANRNFPIISERLKAN